MMTRRAYTTLIFILAGLALLTACRMRYEHSQSTSHDSIQLKASKLLELFQVQERYDSLGRLTERTETQVRSRDSLSHSRHTTTSQEATKETKPSPTSGGLWGGAFASIKLYIFLLILGAVLGVYLYRKVIR